MGCESLWPYARGLSDAIQDLRESRHCFPNFDAWFLSSGEEALEMQDATSFRTPSDTKALVSSKKA